MLKLWKGIFLFISLSLLVSATEKVDLHLVWKNQFQFAGYYMAKEKGLYRDKDIDVSISEYNPKVNNLKKVLKANNTFAVGRSSLIVERLNGNNIVLLASIFQHSPIILLSKKRKDIKSIADLKGKKIMLLDNHLGLASITAMLTSNGINESEYKHVNHTFDVEDLIQDKIDVMLAYATNEPFSLEKKGIEYSIFNPKDFDFDFYSDILYTSESLMNKKPQLVHDFREASLAGWEYAMGHIDETIALILKKYNTQNRSKDDLLHEAKAMIKLIDGDNIALGTISKKKIDRLVQVYRLLGLVQGNNSLENFLYVDSESHFSLGTANQYRFNIDGFLEKILPLVTKPVYDLDTQNLPNTLKHILQDNSSVKAILVKESLDGDILFRYFLDDNKQFFNQSIPQRLKDISFKKQDIIVDDETIGSISIYYKDENDIGLTSKEKLYIETHTIKVGVEQWPPVVFSNDTHDIDGIAGSFIKKAIEKTSLKIEVVNDNWNILLEDFKKHKLDLLPATYKTKKRTLFGTFGSGYFKMKDAIYIKSTTKNIHSLHDLEGETLAIPEGYGTIEKLQNKFPKIKLVFTKDLEMSINYVLNGDAKAFYEGRIAADTKINQELIKGLRSISVKAFKAPSLHFFTQLHDKTLASILDKVLKSLSYQEKNEIINSWTINKSVLNLTAHEKEWLLKKEIINYSYNANFAPFEWINEVGLHVGIISDILKLVGDKTGITFRAIEKKSLEDAISAVKKDDVTMISALEKTEAREKHLNFSKQSIYENATMFITHFDDKTIYLDIKKDFTHKKIAVLKNHNLGKYLKKKYPYLDFVEYKTAKEGFEAVRSETVDMLAVNSTLAQYYIKTQGFTDVKVAMKLDYMFHLKMAFSKNASPVLISILDKALAQMTKKEIGDIYDKWTRSSSSDEINWSLMLKLLGLVLVVILFMMYNTYRLRKAVKEKTEDINRKNDELETVMASFDKNVIFTRTNLEGKIIHASEAFCEISGYKVNEVLGKSHNIVRHPDSPPELFKTIWTALKQESCIEVEMKNLKKDGGFYWVKAKFEPEYDKDGTVSGYSALRDEITYRKEVEALSYTLEKKVEEQTKDLKKQLRVVKIAERKQTELIDAVNMQKEFVQTLLDSQEQIIVTTKGNALMSVNEQFYDFFAVDSIEDFQEEYNAPCICKVFNTNAPSGFIQESMERESWIDYVISRSFGHTHKVMISRGSIDFIFSVTGAKLPGDDMKSAVFTDITEMEKAKREVETIHRHTKESIEYASLIQHSLIPEKTLFEHFFKESFTIWQPKDVVGGDIYLMEKISDHEVVLMLIDCTGHGVPGAFVSMLVKAIERQLIANVHKDKNISPAKILSIFNGSIKHVLKQDSPDSISNAGFDGGILYYNSKDKIIRFAGAETPLFYYQNEKMHTIKGDRHSIGYKKSDVNYVFKETTIDVSIPTKIFLTTDGYIDQCGGGKGFPFGKKHFLGLLTESIELSMDKKQELLLSELEVYEKGEDRNDDITIIGLEI